MSKDIDDEVRCMRMANGEHGLIAKTDAVVEMSECKECGWGARDGFDVCDICSFAGNALRNQERGAEKERAKMHARLEKVRDELKSATDLTETHQYGYFKAGNALRMLEAILEGKEP